MNRLQHFQTHQSRYEIALILILFLVNATILATSFIMESYRKDDQSVAMWEPFVWEYTSAIATIILLPGILALIKRFPFEWPIARILLLVYLPASVVFSLLHTFIMVSIRKLCYWFQGLHYDFGNIPYELFYEFRKDIWSFFSLILIILSYRFIVSRIQGEATVIEVGEDTLAEPAPERLLVKKLGKEFILRVEDIEWLEASGNYVNLHSKGRVYPLRITLQQLIEQIGSKGFARIHRSYGVNLNVIESIQPQPSGDSEIKTQSGELLQLSRRYKDSFKSQLSA